MTVEVSKQTLNDVYLRVLAIEKSERIKNAVIFVLGAGMLVAVAVIVMLSLALQARNAAVDRNQTVGECRDDAFAMWADSVRDGLVGDAPVEDIDTLEDAYDACGQR